MLIFVANTIRARIDEFEFRNVHMSSNDNRYLKR